MAKTKASKLADRYELASDELSTRTIATLDGEVGTGKTYFALTGPEEILFQNIDNGTEGVIEEFRREGKQIYEVKYEWNPGQRGDDEDDDVIDDNGLQEIAIEVRDRWEKDYYYAIRNGARTIVWDTESRIWQCHRYAEFGAPNDNPKNYDKLNQRFEAMINEAKRTPGANLFLIRSMKDKWGAFGAKNKQTGQRGFGKGGREVWGYEHLPGMVFEELTFLHLDEGDELRETLEAEHGEGSCEYVIKFGKCRHNGKLAFTYTPRCSFPMLGELLVPESSSSDWE